MAWQTPLSANSCCTVAHNSASKDPLKKILVEDDETQATALNRVGLPPDARGVIFGMSLGSSFVDVQHQQLPSLTRWIFCLVLVATQQLHTPQREKVHYRFDSGLLYLGWLMGLEPTTTGITILDSTN